MFRTDPLTDDGRFDNEFFVSPFYEDEQRSLVKYLELEGFSEKKEDFVIDYKSRRWHINPNKKTK